MTKSGGFSIKKRHRKLGALIGLAALAVPFAANLGTLGDAIHAVTGPQNVYESELLNVKLKTSQDKTKTTWDLEFNRSDMSVSEQTVKFKLDLEKAGLKDAEIKQDDKALDMREGIVSAVLKSQSTHLILTAISTNEDKHDITLPITELGLYDDKNGENRLEADSRSVDLTMAFEKVAEITKESSSSETVTEAVAEAEKQSEGGKNVRVVPGETGGFITAGGTDPISKVNGAITTNPLDSLQAVLIDRSSRTTPKADGTTNPQNFQIWSSDATNTTYLPDGTTSIPTGANAKSINIVAKYDVARNKIDGQQNWPRQAGDSNDPVLYYHSQYQRAGSNANQSSYLINFGTDAASTAAMQAATFEMFYDNVGYYIDKDGVSHDIGATMTIGNIVAASDNAGGLDHIQLGNRRFIDLPNNMFSGLIYHGIESLDVKIQFYVVDATSRQFIQKIDVPTDSKTEIDFSSLNNFGVDGTSGNFDTNWDRSADNIQSSEYAETVNPITDIKGDVKPNKGTNIETVANPTSMRYDDDRDRWYSLAHGDYANDDGTFDLNTYNNIQWRDSIDDTQTFQRGMLGYYVSGLSFAFRLYTATGNTWQTLASSTQNDISLPAPKKAVSDNGFDKNQILNQMTPTKSGNFDTEDMADVDTAEQRDGDTEPYFYYSYYILQDTYEIGTSKLTKPDQIKMVDVLPHDVILQGTTLDQKGTVSNEVSMYNTNDGKLTNTNNSLWTVSVEPVDVTGDADPSQNVKRQQVTVTLTAAGIAALDFTGSSFMWDLPVKVKAGLAETKGKQTFTNKASVTTDSARDTNTVVTYENPHTGRLKITKVDAADATIQLSGATFKISSRAAGSTDAFVEFTADEYAKYVTQAGAILSLKELPSDKHYQILETKAPNGYDYDATKEYLFTVNYNEITEELTVTSDTAGWTITAPTATDPDATATITNERQAVYFDVLKQDEDGNALPGATFKYREYTESGSLTTTGDQSGWTQMDRADGAATSTETAKLKFDTIYQVSESEAPSGYVAGDDFFFKITHDSDGKVVYQYVNADGSLVEGAATIVVDFKTDSSDENIHYYVGHLKAKNYAKSIFPRVGGTGIQAYIGAGLIVMLIAGGAAWYIKRRQNQ
ncbi:SpaA isopeptide-forming pilin-related protein [Weissella confusa]